MWEADGRPEGRERDYWLKAKEEFASQSAVGEEAPLAALDDEPPAAPREEEMKG